MNSWQMRYDLSISKKEALNLLGGITMGSKKGCFTTNGFYAEISGNQFEFMVKRSLIWGTAFWTEIRGKGIVVENQSGSSLSAVFELCAPFKYVDLNKKRLCILVPLFILSWLGLIFTMIDYESLLFLNLILSLIFFSTGLILLIGYHKYFFVADGIRELQRTFDITYGKFAKK